MRSHRVLAIVALSFLGSALLAQEPSPSGPSRMEIRPASWDLGTVSPGQYQQVFEIVNQGGEALTIEQVRVSHPLRMSASVVPLGTEPGRRFQLTVVVVLDGTEPSFSGFAIVHSNDKERPHVKIEVGAKLPASSGNLVVFHSEEGPGIKKIRERIAALKLQAEVVSSGDLSILDRLRKLEKEHGVAQTAAYELFMGRESLIASDPEEVLKGIERVAAGGTLQGRKVHPHQHDPQKPGGPARTSPLVPPPVTVDLFLDPGCAACVEAGRRGAEALNKQYEGRISISARDVTHPDSVKLFQDRLAGKDCPPGTHAVVLVAGVTWVIGEIPAIFEALPGIVDKELAGLSRIASGERGGSAPGASTAGAAPKSGPSAVPSGGGTSAVQWILVVLTSLILVRVCTQWNRGAEVSAPK
ncbi:MAG: hypothetical protein AAB434_12110 [Planctomycetota bacterium]